MNATPDSLTPRRFTIVIIARIARQSGSVYGWSDRHGRDQSADARRDADGHDQDVVEHQRRGGEQAGAGAQVLLGHGVRPAAVRIGRDRLPVREVDHHEQAR